jgi:hypothetical protein
VPDLFFCAGSRFAYINLPYFRFTRYVSLDYQILIPRGVLIVSAADGYARADGIGALYIKRLSQAVADGDPIRAVIRGTAFNANGRTGGITHPSPEGQAACIQRAYERAGGLDMSLTGYFECHGTGTPVG